MALVGRRDGRNFGHGTVKARCDRWQVFVKWCHSEEGPDINYARQVLADFGGYLREVVRLNREAQHVGRINIQGSTKEGRAGASGPRWITVKRPYSRCP